MVSGKRSHISVTFKWKPHTKRLKLLNNQKFSLLTCVQVQPLPLTWLSLVMWFWRSTSREKKLRKADLFWRNQFLAAAPQWCSWERDILKICSKFTGEHPCQSMISIKLLCNFIEITFQDGFSLVDLLHISEHLFIRTPMNGYFWILFLFTETIAISTHYGKSVVPLSLHLVIREWSWEKTQIEKKRKKLSR